MNINGLSEKKIMSQKNWNQKTIYVPDKIDHLWKQANIEAESANVGIGYFLLTEYEKVKKKKEKGFMNSKIIKFINYKEKK